MRGYFSKFSLRALYSTTIKVSSGPYLVKPLGFWVVRLWKEPFNLAFGSHHHSCMPLFIRRTRTFRNPSCRTLFSSLATTPSSSSMMFSGILQLTTFCAVVLQFLWHTSFQAGPPQCCCIKPERLDTETSLSICSLDLWRRAPCITVCNTKDLELTVIFLLRLKVAVCPRPSPPLFPLWCLWWSLNLSPPLYSPWEHWWTTRSKCGPINEHYGKRVLLI